ncbi:hypothetical protein HPB47_006172, partial [Ixodes persulcatus]
ALVSCLTTYFWEFKDTRMVLDCTEIEIERPKDLMSRLLTYSHYKRTYTAKQSQLLDRCTPHVDSVIVDKEFLINELRGEKMCE